MTPETNNQPNSTFASNQQSELTDEVFKEANKGRNPGQTLKRLAEMGFSIGQTGDYLIAAATRESSTVTNLKSLTHAQLKGKVAGAPGDLVEGLIPEHSVNIVVGDSGLGKTPLFVQLALCVAAGIPFLGHPCRKGRVLYVDYENGLAPFDRLLDTILEYLGLEKAPDDFHHLHQPAEIKEVYAEIDAFGPDLVIIDAMRGFDPDMEEKNSRAGFRIKELEKKAENGPAFLLMHHIRKDDPKNTPPPLVNSDIMMWLQRACGARALINQTNVRLGIDARGLNGKAELIIKGYYKIEGAFGPIHVGRNRDEDDVPIGYYRLTGVELLPPDERSVYDKLPDPFGFTDVERVSEQGPRVVNEWLLAWLAAGVIEKRGASRSRTKYHKIHR